MTDNFSIPPWPRSSAKNAASITNGKTPLTGTSDVAASVKALIAAFFTARPGAEAPVLIANGAYAAAIKGQVPGFGLEVMASEAALNNIILMDPTAVFYAAGELEVVFTRDAMLQMNDAPTRRPPPARCICRCIKRTVWAIGCSAMSIRAAARNAVKYSTMP